MIKSSEQAINYKDINLIPNTKDPSSIKSRDEVSTEVKFGPDLTLKVPIIASPMESVSSPETCRSIIDSGGYGILHRFNTISEQIQDFIECNRDQVACAIGISVDDKKRYERLYSAGCRYFCVDVANGYNKWVKEFIIELNKPGTKIIAGNIAWNNGFDYLCELDSVIACRSGISFGAGCTTKNSTGVCSPMVSMLKSLQNSKYTNKIMADGGIREPQDFCKAIALGANTVMAGSIFASCSDSPAEKITGLDGVKRASYSGSASEKVQHKYRPQVKYVEGRTVELAIDNKTVAQRVIQYQDGLKSCMSYYGAKTIDEFQDCFKH